MKAFIKKNHLLIFFTAWLLVNLIQAAGTGLFDDEAYYWIYSLFPAWGYFDHPPAIAMLIKAGYSIFPNELGLRLFIVLLNSASIFLIYQLCDKKRPALFYSISFSILLAQIGGIIAVPDIPLLFCISLFFFIYSHYIKTYSYAYGLLLGLCMSMMMYSKYHAVLIILCTLLSNSLLWKKASAYIAVVTAIILFIPHLYWQYSHGFPSVQFHLFERNAVHYRSAFTLEYIAGQLALAGPVAGWLLLWASFRYRPQNLLEKALKYSLVGIYAFFLVSSLKGRVEANWTVPAFVALMVLSYHYLSENKTLRLILYYSLPLSLIICLSARIFMLLPMAPSSFISKDEFHDNQKDAQAIKNIAGNMPVVMLDSYQKPSKYWFYAKEPAMALNTAFYRRNNFNYWPVEDSFIGKKAFVIGSAGTYFNIEIPGPRYAENGGHFINPYFSFGRIMITNIKLQARQSADLLEWSCQISTPEHYLPLFRQRPYADSRFLLALYNDNGDVAELIPCENTISEIQSAESQMLIRCRSHWNPGKYKGRLCIASCIPGQPTMNSIGFSFVVK